MTITTVGIVSAVTPSVVETYISHYLNRGQLRHKPTAHISYHEGLRLLRQFLDYASKHTVEDLQAFTAQWVPVPTWVKTENVDIGTQYLYRASKLIETQLGPKGIEQVGGSAWWQWRKIGHTLRAEWIEMKKDVTERKLAGRKIDRVMMYVHGGAYYMASVDEHRYQIQRHARKLKARVLAPRYRLAPQYPFPCALQDVLACYLFLLDVLEPSQILIAGDSAGAGMALSMLVILRDQKVPLPAGAMLLSPWVDLTHSFPSVAGDGKQDYIPPHGFHHKPSLFWPPPNAEDLRSLHEELDAMPNQKTAPRPNAKPLDSPPDLSIEIDGETIQIKDQIQMYTVNAMLAHPLVSPVQQPSLGGLPPLLIQTGGGELLHDEQVYLAHKAADPQRYRPSDAVMAQYDLNKDDITRYDPTYVQLQVWDDLCHVPHTLSFTRPAKYMFRSVAQFGAWALAHAQKTDVDIDDDANSIISSGDDTDLEAEQSFSSSTVDLSKTKKRSRSTTQDQKKPRAQPNGAVGRAGDPLPPFKDHMIRQRVDRYGITFPLAAASEYTCLQLEPNSIGAIKAGPVRKWLAKKREMDSKFAAEKRKVQKKRLKDMAAGYETFSSGDVPPPTALAGRRRQDMPEEKKAKKSWALAMWSGWGSHHDEETIERSEKEKQERPSDAATRPASQPDLSAPAAQATKTVRKTSSSTMLTVPRTESRPKSRRVSDIGQADEAVLADSLRSAAVSPAMSSGTSTAAVEPPTMSNIAPESTKLEGSENTFTAPGNSRPHNGVSAYPFKLRNTISSASTTTLDDASSAAGTGTVRSTPAQSVAPVESHVPEKEVIMPYYHEKEVVVVSSPYQQLQRTPSELAASTSRATPTQGSVPPANGTIAYRPASQQSNLNRAATSMASPVEARRPRNPAFDSIGAASSKFSAVEPHAIGAPKPAGFAYSPRDLRDAMLHRQAVETTATNNTEATSSSTLFDTAPLSPTGYVAPVELPVTPDGGLARPVVNRQPSAISVNENEPVELSTVKQTRTSMLPPPRSQLPATPTLELSAMKQTRNSILPPLSNESHERPESPTLRPSTMASNESGSASVASTSSPISKAPLTALQASPKPAERVRPPIPGTIKPMGSRTVDEEVPPTPPPKDTKFVDEAEASNSTHHARTASKPPVIAEVSLGSDLGLEEEMQGFRGSP